jgi:hypothetical protein
MRLRVPGEPLDVALIDGDAGSPVSSVRLERSPAQHTAPDAALRPAAIPSGPWLARAPETASRCRHASQLTAVRAVGMAMAGRCCLLGLPRRWTQPLPCSTGPLAVPRPLRCRSSGRGRDG